MKLLGLWRCRGRPWGHTDKSQLSSPTVRPKRNKYFGQHDGQGQYRVAGRDKHIVEVNQNHRTKIKGLLRLPGVNEPRSESVRVIMMRVTDRIA